MFLPKVCVFALVVIVATLCAAQGVPAPQQGGNVSAPASGNLSTGVNSPAMTSTPPAANNAPNASGASTPTMTAPEGTTTPAVSANPSSNANASAKAARSGDRDPLLDLPALPKGKIALQGGTLLQVDPVRDRLVMRPFGQRKKAEVAFDVRTQFTRDGKVLPVRELRPGSQIYADTIWDGEKVFAKSVRIFTGSHQDQEHGQILAFDPGSGSLRVRDELFPDPVDLKVSKDTVIRKDQSPGTVADLRAGSLVAIKFQPGSRGQVYQVDVLATPGSQFVFSGPITHIDLLTHVIGISNRSDSIIYDIHFDPERVRITPELQEGADVDVNATFDGSKYFANTVAIRSARNSQ